MSQIERVAVKYVPEDIKKKLYNNAAFLMNGALNFVANIEKIVEQYEHIRKNISFFAQPLSDLKIAMLKNEQLLKRAIFQQYLFEQQLNKFLGRTINFAWVNVETGETYFATETTARSIYEQAGRQSQKKKGALTGKIYKSNVINNASKIPFFVEQEFQDLVQKRISIHQAMLKEIFRRWEQNHNKNNKNARGNFDTVYWKGNPDGVKNSKTDAYRWSAKVNRGYISQEYINFIFNSKYELSDSEYGIGTFMMGGELSGKKNAIPGIVKGDIVVNDTNESIQIAVKSHQFDTASIGPYLRVAFQIIGFYENLDSLTVQKVKEILKEMETKGRYNQKITEAGRRQAEAILKNTIESTGVQVS